MGEKIMKAIVSPRQARMLNERYTTHRATASTGDGRTYGHPIVHHPQGHGQHAGGDGDVTDDEEQNVDDGGGDGQGGVVGVFRPAGGEDGGNDDKDAADNGLGNNIWECVIAGNQAFHNDKEHGH